jgi:hypothetical protein
MRGLAAGDGEIVTGAVQEPPAGRLAARIALSWAIQPATAFPRESTATCGERPFGEISTGALQELPAGRLDAWMLDPGPNQTATASPTGSTATSGQ